MSRRRVARIAGVALTPGVSANHRLYTAEAIRGAAERLQARIDGGEQAVMLTHHEAEGDNTRIVGRLTKAYATDDGTLRYEADVADTPHGQTVASLARHGYLSGVSIRGRWTGPTRYVDVDGLEGVETADGIEVLGLDWSHNPGVRGARVDTVVAESARQRGELTEVCDTASLTEDEGDEGRRRYHDYEPDEDVAPPCAVCGAARGDEAHELPDDDDMEGAADPELEGEPELEAEEEGEAVEHVLDNGTCTTCAVSEADKTPYGPKSKVAYADPGYQSDGVARYPIDTERHVRAAWSYINKAKNAAKYTSKQLKRVKQRIRSAAKRFGIEISDETAPVAPDSPKEAAVPEDKNKATQATEQEPGKSQATEQEPATQTQAPAAPAFDAAAFAAQMQAAVAEGVKAGVTAALEAAKPAAPAPAPAPAPATETAPATQPAQPAKEPEKTLTPTEQLAEALKDPEAAAHLKAALIERGIVPGRKATRQPVEGAKDKQLHEMTSEELRAAFAESLPKEWAGGQHQFGAVFGHVRA